MAAQASPPVGDRLAELRSSAKGWHGVQIAVLGFIGLCGVLHSPGDGTPKWIQTYAAIVVLIALALACAATWLVGRAAWPLYGFDERDEDAVAVTGARLRRGVVLTFASVALTALAAASGWWPADTAEPAASASVELRAGDQSFCGRLEPGRAGAVTVVTADQRVTIPLGSLTELAPVDGC